MEDTLLEGIPIFQLMVNKSNRSIEIKHKEFFQMPMDTQIQLYISFFGLIFNSIIIWITSNLVAKKAGRYNVFLLLLAIVDMVYLCSACMVKEGVFGQIGFKPNWFNCSMIKYIVHLSGLLSSWLVSLVSFERFICVRWPLYSHVSGKQISIIICLALFTFFSVASLATFRASEVVLENNSLLCIVRGSDDTLFRKIVIPIMSSLYSIIPATIVFIFNIFIIRILIKQKDFKKSAVSATSSCKENKTRSITVMLLTVGFIFAACRLPTCIFHLTDIISKDYFNYELFQNYGHISSVLNTIDILDRALNLFVYLFSSSVFRAHAFNQLRCGHK